MGEFGVGLIIVGIVLLVIYLIPSLIAIERKKDSKLLIILLNVFLGWSVICWVIALIWALTKNDEPQQIIVMEKKKEVNYEQLEKLNELLERNIITNEEFETQKRKILAN